MKRERHLITSEDFKKYGIEEEYTVDVCVKDMRKRLRELRKKKTKAGNKKNQRWLQGYAGTVGLDRVKDNISIEAWEKAQGDLLQDGAKTVFFNHDTDKPIGVVKKTAVDGVGLLVDVLISKAKDVDDIWTKIKEGILNALSIRLKPKKIEVVKDEESGRIIEYIIKEMQLFEVSVVGLPANQKATINEVIGKSFKKAISKKNKSRSKKMKKKSKTDRRKTITEAVDEILADNEDIKSLKGQAETNAEALKSVTSTLQSLTDAVNVLANKSLTDEEKKKRKEQEEQEKLKELEEKDPTQAAILKSLTAITARLENVESGSKRKGSQEDDEEDEEGVPRKTLKSAADEDTVKFVLHCLGDGAEPGDTATYETLSDTEKQKCKEVYSQLFMAQISQ